MRSTPARVLVAGHLLVDADGSVSKIAAVEYPIPLNLVSVDLVDQLTDERRTRSMPWDQHVMVEQPYSVTIGNTGRVTVELAKVANEERRPVYRYSIHDPARGVAHQAADISLGSGRKPDIRKAMDSLLSFLGAAAEAYRVALEGRESENADLFPQEVSLWAYEFDNELQMAQLDLGDGGLSHQ